MKRSKAIRNAKQDHQRKLAGKALRFLLQNEEKRTKEKTEGAR